MKIKTKRFIYLFLIFLIYGVAADFMKDVNLPILGLLNTLALLYCVEKYSDRNTLFDLDK